MNTWNSIMWAPICFGLTGAGLVLSWFTWRRRGIRRGIRAVAWSLLPLAAYLTGGILLIGRIGSAIVQFSTAFVFSPKTWSGVILFCLSALIFLTSGGLPVLSWRKKRASKKAVSQQSADGGKAVTPAQGNRAVAQVGAAKTAKPAKPGKGGSDDDGGLDPEVSAILRRHGIS